jgi:SNF2 family DNA or RNA helicase
MGKKRKIKKPAALLAQRKAHLQLAGELSKLVPAEVIEHWKKEAERFEREARRLMTGLPASYLEEIERISDEEAKKLLRRKRRKIV